MDLNRLTLRELLDLAYHHLESNQQLGNYSFTIPGHLLRDLSVAVTTIEVQLPSRSMILTQLQESRTRVISKAQSALTCLARVRKHLIIAGASMETISDFGLAAKPPQQPRDILALSRRSLGTNLFHADTETEIPEALAKEMEVLVSELDAILEELESSESQLKSFDAVISLQRATLVARLDECRKLVSDHLPSPRKEMVLQLLGWVAEAK